MPVDYTGWGWSLPRDPAPLRWELQRAALLQLAVTESARTHSYFLKFNFKFGRTKTCKFWLSQSVLYLYIHLHIV